MKRVWNEVKASIKSRIPDHSFRMWIEPLRIARCDENCMVLFSPNFFSKKRVLENYGAMIESEIKRVLGRSCRLSIEISATVALPKSKADDNFQLSLPNITARPHNGRLLKKDFTFDHFVVGKNNDFAYSASLSMASTKNSSQSALFLLSKTGMGKSHLTQAVGHFILSEHPSDRVYYTTAEGFSNEMVRAYQHNSINAFKEKYRNQCDVLLLEDVHYLRGKERTQIELALTLDTLLEAGKKIIFSSCYLPADIPKLDDKLRSRLSCGLISNIDPPDFKTRVRILQKKSRLNGCKIPENIIHYLASELTEDVRQLESGLMGVTAKSLLLGEPIDFKLAESVTKNIIRQRKNITIDVIKKMVCKNYKISITDIVSSSRKKSIVRPRQIAIYLSRRYTDTSLQAIGRSFNRYHATALHSIGAIERELKENGPLQKQVDFFCKKLESGKF
ncbi:MAG: chromosomal replication initiator protein DnaA [Thermodesulfobacteriota bacterium]|nr:chromosomal replication initiator protein DnaA [Thermodesulfobacteriota bacterium]